MNGELIVIIKVMKIYSALLMTLMTVGPAAFAQPLTDAKQPAAPQAATTHSSVDANSQSKTQDSKAPESAALADAAKACAEENRDLCENLYLKTAATGSDAEKLSAYEELAMLRQEAGDTANAVEYWTLATRADSQDAFARLMRGWAFLSLGKAKPAEDDFSMALSLTANQAISIDARIGSGMTQMAQGSYQKAAETFQGLYIRDPYTIALTAYLAAEAFYRQDRLAAAMTYVQQSLKHDGQNLPAQLLQAVLYEKLDNPIAAWQAYSSLSELDPWDENISRRMTALAKNLKGDSSRYLYYTRLTQALSSQPRTVDSPALRLAVYSNKFNRPAELTSVEFVSNSSFTVTDEKFGPVAAARATRTWSAEWNPVKHSVDIKDNWSNIEHSAPRMLTLESDPQGNSILLKNAKLSGLIKLDNGDRELRGKITLIPGENGFSIINTVKLEDFLPGALAADREDGTPAEALKALAVVLRTRALEAIAQSKEKLYDLCDNSSGMLYRGVNMESPAVTDAVDTTRGQTLSGIDAATLGAGFNTACGGISTTGAKDTAHDLKAQTAAQVAIKILGNPPADLLCSPDDPTLWSSVKWAVFLEPEPVERRLAAISKFGKLKGIVILKRDAYGRAQKVRFIGSDGEAVITGAEQINRVLSAGALRSTLFLITPFYSGSKITRMLVRGLGTGSGEGMCLHGARAMAESGSDYKAILQKYFPQTALTGEAAKK